ncbi:MAG TPA: homoserine kinase [Bacteroidales bacterium]|nr:homoserine kinase [Bacteroidales bacterium]HQI70921.1 homoserine kinase [Bacteroidales bacterium]
MKKIRLRGPATTANVGPGYDIFAMALKEPHDEIALELTDDQQISITVENNPQQIIPLDPQKNTAGLAILEIKKRYHLDFGVKVTISKLMTSGGGLGTTGASSAAAVYGLNKLLNLNLSANEMVDIARFGEVASGGSPHADNVAAALLGGFVLVKNYNPLEVVKLEMPEFPVVLAVIQKKQGTTRGLITYEIGQEKLKDQMAHCCSVIHSIMAKDLKEFGKAISVDHIAEPVRAATIMNYFETKEAVLRAGAYGTNVSGGGSSVFAVCEASLQDEIAGIMEKGLGQNPNFDRVIKTTTSNAGVTIIG